MTIRSVCGWLTQKEISKAGRCGQLRRLGQKALGDRVEEDEDADGGVEDRLDEEGRGDRRVGGVGDLALDQEDLGHVAGPGGEDRVDPGAGQVGGAELQEGDRLAG